MSFDNDYLRLKINEVLDGMNEDELKVVYLTVKSMQGRHPRLPLFLFIFDKLLSKPLKQLPIFFIHLEQHFN